MNAVLDGSPRRCNGVVLARLRAAAIRAKSHVIHPVGPASSAIFLSSRYFVFFSDRVACASMLDVIAASR